MAQWIAHRAAGFVVNPADWNQVTDALGDWLGDTNAGGHNLSNVGTLNTGALNITGNGDRPLLIESSNGAGAAWVKYKRGSTREWWVGVGVLANNDFCIYDFTAGAARLVIDTLGNVSLPNNALNITSSGGSTFADTVTITNANASAQVQAGIVRIVSANSDPLNAILTCIRSGGAGTPFAVYANGVTMATGQLRAQNVSSDNVDTFIVVNAAGNKYLTIKPEAALTNNCELSYWIGSGYGRITVNSEFVVQNQASVLNSLHIHGPGSGSEGGELHLADPTGSDYYVIDNLSGNIRFFRSNGVGVVLQISPAGQISMMLNGVLKNLSVDGSGFVKAS